MTAISELPPVEIEGHEPSGLGGVDHPMRLVTRRAAGLEGDAPWDPQTRLVVTEVFDGLASEWHTRTSPARAAVVDDALDRGEVTGSVCVEVGSGIGAYSPMLAARHDLVLAVDLAEEMLRLAPAGPAHRIRADGAELPVADAIADTVVLVNAFLFPAEVDRVLGPGGVLVWVNSSGEQTPIHLTPEEVAQALPGDWSGVTSRAGAGLWCVLHRAGERS